MRLIDADALVKQINEKEDGAFDRTSDYYASVIFAEQCAWARHMVEKAPTIELREDD